MFDRSRGFRQPWGSDGHRWVGNSGSPLAGGSGQYVEPVYNIAKAANYIGDPRSRLGQQGGPVNTKSASSPTINAYITVGGGGMSEPEARRAGSVIADTLAGEMKSRLARSY
jgi:hypothetical protein